MIQGGDPKTKDPTKRREWGTGNGPRTLKDEFSSVKKHERGVLSMASSGPNTASCQFFVMHGPYPSLDGKYSCFGRLVSGFETLDKIATANGTFGPDRTVSPAQPQRIEKTIIMRVKAN
jgi:cyclophilin family peptidyl-prolyl cis-trans isomerase